MNFVPKENERYSFVVGDPGKANFSMAFVSYVHDLCLPFERRFGLKWFALFDFGEGRSSTGKKTRKTDNVLDDWNAMESTLNANESLNDILSKRWTIDDDGDNYSSDENIRILFENAEGVRDLNVMTRLIRVNFLIGCIVSWITTKFGRSHVEIGMVGKTLKFGYSEFNQIFKEKCVTGEIDVSSKTTDGLEAIKRTHRKTFACGVVRSTIYGSPFTSKDMKQSVRATCDTNFNHIADAFSQTMAFVASKLTRTQLRVPTMLTYEKSIEASPILEAIRYAFTPPTKRRQFEFVKQPLPVVTKTSSSSSTNKKRLRSNENEPSSSSQRKRQKTTTMTPVSITSKNNIGRYLSKRLEK